jgi:hypothetical protein
MLIGYIPTTRLAGISNNTARRCALGNVFHFCMQNILTPIAPYGETGVTMMSGNGIWCRCHPILAAFVGDYPEQALVTCTYHSQCPKCIVPTDKLGERCSFPPHNSDEAFKAFCLSDGDIHTFHSACCKAGLKPVFHPFWKTLPLTDIFVSITPDVLHQLLQGVMKHLIAWVTSVDAFRPSQVNARCRSLPPNHHIATFVKGITTLSRVTGLEHKNMCKILLGLIIDLPLPSGAAPAWIIRAVHTLLNFLYLAQFPSHATDTLNLLDEAVDLFHLDKQVFVDLGICDHFNFPKLHSLLHYKVSITLFGTTDNYNTEQTEWLHIDFTKDAYHASNHKDEYPQMTAWLEHCEKVQQHSLFVTWRQQAEQESVTDARLFASESLITRYDKMVSHGSFCAQRQTQTLM